MVKDNPSGGAPHLSGSLYMPTYDSGINSATSSILLLSIFFPAQVFSHVLTLASSSGEYAETGKITSSALNITGKRSIANVMSIAAPCLIGLYASICFSLQKIYMI